VLSQIPLPTDNIYKFYALFGILVLLTTGIMFFIRHEYYNAMAFEHYIPIETLKARKELTEEQKRELFLIEQKSEIAKSDKNFELGTYIACFLIFGCGLTVYGFYHWHTKVQPKQDRLLELQIHKAESEATCVRKDVAMITADELAGILETAHLLRSPVNAKRLLTSLDRVRKTSGKPQTIDDLRNEVGFE
jgi:hypothetical protein